MDANSNQAPLPLKSDLHFLPEGSEQINVCRNPRCSNYLKPSQYPLRKPVKNGKESRLDTYKRIDVKGAKTLICKVCGASTQIKNKFAIDTELQRLKKKFVKDVDVGCPNESCTNHKIPTSTGKENYYSHGKNSAGNPRFKCKKCGKTFAINTRSLNRQRSTKDNNRLFELLVNKVPFRRIMSILDMNERTFYRKLDFIYQQCRLFSQHKEQNLQSLLSERTLNLSSDSQFHLVNWTQRFDKRNTQLLAVTTACNDTSFIFGCHLNYDPYARQEDVETEVANNYEQYEEPSFRKTAHYWTLGDYVSSIDKKSAKQLNSQDEISRKYQEFQRRLNSEEKLELDDYLKLPDKGVLIHSDYTTIAHFCLISEITSKAKRVNHFFDQDASMRSAFHIGYLDRIQKLDNKRINGVYVGFSKKLTVTAKQEIFQAKKDKLHEYMGNNGLTSEFQAAREILKKTIPFATSKQSSYDSWIPHPLPSMVEPKKNISHINDFGILTDDEKSWVYINATLNGVDRFFMQVRRMLSLLERPVSSASNAGNNWNGYNAYNPEVVVKVLEIFRVYYNYCKAGNDGETPAERIGLSKGSNNVKELLLFHPNKKLSKRKSSFTNDAKSKKLPVIMESSFPDELTNKSGAICNTPLCEPEKLPVLNPKFLKNLNN